MRLPIRICTGMFLHEGFQDPQASAKAALELIAQGLTMSGYRQDLRDIAGYVQGLRDMAETAQSCICLVLSDGGQIYLKSTWEATNFSIVVLDGVHAWSRTVSAKDVVSIATSWNIDVGELMKSARSHLCRQHPTSSYLLTPDMDIRAASNVVQLSFTIENLFEGIEGNETLNFNLHLTRISDVGAVFRDMLQHLLDTKDKLEEQLKEAEWQYQKKLHHFTATEPEPSISLSFARPSATPRRQSSSSLIEPRLLDFNRSEERHATRSVCSLTPMRAHDQLHHDTPKVATRLPPPPSFDLQDHGAKHNVENLQREPVSFSKDDLPRSCAVNESRTEVRDDDLTVHARESYKGFKGPLSSGIMRVLDKVTVPGGAKITEMRSPARREEQPQRSFMVETNSVCIDVSSMRNSTNGRRSLFEEEGSQRTTTILRQTSVVPESQLNADIAAEVTRSLHYNGGLEEDMNFHKSETINWSAFSEKKELPENHNCHDVNGGILEKGSSNAGEPGRSQVRGLNTSAEGEAKEGSDEEPTSKVTLEGVHLGRKNSDSGNLRAKSGFSEKPRSQWSTEARSTPSTEEQHEEYEEQQKLAQEREKHLQQQKLADTEPRGPVRHEFPVENRLNSVWSDVSIDTIARPSTTRSDKKLRMADTPEYTRQKSTCSHPPVVELPGRKRVMEREDFRGKPLSSVKLEAEYSDLAGTEKSAQKYEVMDLEEYEKEELKDEREHKRSRPFQSPDAPVFARKTIAELLKEKTPAEEDEGEGRGRVGGRGRGRGRGRKMQEHLSADESPSENGRRRRLRSDRSPSEEGHVLDPDESNVDNFHVPDPDFYDFDKERTEELIVPGQVWAVYDEKDGFPRVCALVDKVSRRPQFEVSITWLIPYNPYPEAVEFFQKSGYPMSCGRFELGGEHVLTSINIFSHRMEFNWLSRNVGTIYPKKGEVWATYTKKMLESGFATHGGGANKSFFRLVHVLEDLGAEMRPYFQVLEKVNAFRTVWRPRYQPGSIEPKYLTHFSHRVPACQLQGDEGPNAVTLEGYWDVDPAALPSSQSG